MGLLSTNDREGETKERENTAFEIVNKIYLHISQFLTIIILNYAPSIIYKYFLL